MSGLSEDDLKKILDVKALQDRFDRAFGVGAVTDLTIKPGPTIYIITKKDYGNVGNVPVKKRAYPYEE